MKTRKTSRRFGATHKTNHIVKEQKELAKDRISEIYTKLRMYYAGLERIYAFASGERNLKKPRYSKRAKVYQRTLEDERRLQWAVENLQSQIIPIQQELFQLIRSLT